MKTTRFARMALAALLPAAFAASVHAARPSDPNAEPDIVYRYPLITAPLMSAAPTIDGTVDKAEWLDAAQSAPMVQWRGEGEGNVAEEFACYWIGYTADALHLAWRFDRPIYAIAPKADGSHDANWGDDKIEVMLRPDVGANEQGYNLVINAKGVRADRWNHNVNWDENWQAGARVTSKGWEGELTITFAQMHDRKVKPGDTWEILILRNRLTPSNVVAINSFIHDWPGYPHYGYLRFGAPDEPAVRILDGGAIGAHEAGMTVELATRPGEAAAEVQIETALLVGAEGSTGLNTEITVREDGVLVPKQVNLNFFDAVAELGYAKVAEVMKSVAGENKTVALSADRTLRLPLRAEVPYGAHALTYRVKRADTGAVIAGGAAPFIQKPLFDVTIDNYLLVAGGLKVTADYRRMPDLGGGSRVLAELIEPETGTVLAMTEAPADPRQGRMVKILATPKRFDATYTVRTRVIGKDGNPLAEDKRDVTLPSRPEWYGNTIGITDDPLPGWTPIDLRGDMASVVLRTYQIGPSGLPVTIRSRDKSLLQGPIELLLSGKPLTWSRVCDTVSDGKVVWTARSRYDGIDVTLKTTLEYDGLLTYDMTLAPGVAPGVAPGADAEEGKAELKQLMLRIPYNSAYAMTRRTIGSEIHEFTDGKPLKEFHPGIEISDLDTGLDFWCEWDRHWHVGKQPYAEMNEQGDTIDWLVRMVGDEPKVIDKPITITFALQALPTREVNVSYQYDQRQVHSGSPVYLPRGMTVEDMTHTDMRYPLAGNTTEDAGSVAVRVSHLSFNRLISFGTGADALCVGFARGPWWQYSRRYFLNFDANLAYWTPEGRKLRPTEGQLFAQIVDPPMEDGWTELAFTWLRQEDKVRLVMAVVDALGDVRSSVAVIDYAQWQKAYAGGELILGGGGAIVIDHVVASNKELNPGTLLAGLRDPAAAQSPDLTLVDACDDLRFSRGMFMTKPSKITNGHGGIAGAKYWGVMVKPIEGKLGNAVYLPSFMDHDEWDIGKALNIKYVFPYFEQFHGLLGYYGQNYVHSPAWREAYFRTANQRGFDTTMYTTFGMHAQYDKQIAPFAEELSRKPQGRVYTAIYPSLGTPARDYIIWSLKKMVDEYGIRAFHIDNTINVRSPDSDPFTGHGFYDEEGKLHPRWFLFGARDLAKRWRWIARVHVKDGLMFLGAGARRFPLISGFVDQTASGEGGFFYKGDWSDLSMPEDYSDSLAYKVGVPHITLTKGGGEHRFSPNITFMYMLMNNGTLRMSSFHVNPAAWHVNDELPTPTPWDMRGEYNPYFARSGVGMVGAPMALFWMIQDEMNLRRAEFIPFWRAKDYMTISLDTARCSFHLEKGRHALLIVANFSDAAPVELKLDLEKMGLSHLDLTAYDALTDEPYELAGDTLTMNAPDRLYRLVRIEAK